MSSVNVNAGQSFRFGMVKLQLTPYLPVVRARLKFPLWHGKVATLDGYQYRLLAASFPLWHGKVATLCQHMGFKNDNVSALAW